MMSEKNTNVVFKMLFDEELSPGKGSAHLLYSEEDLKEVQTTAYNEGFEQGYLDGFKQGEEKAIAENQAQIQLLIENLSQRILNLVGQDSLYLNQSTEKAILLTQVIMRKILPNLINTHGISEVEAMIRHIFSTFLEKQSLLIHLHPDTLPIISRDLEDISVQFGKFLNFAPDEKLGVYGCEIEWQGGGALWNQTSTLEKIEEILADSLSKIMISEEPVKIETNEIINEQISEDEISKIESEFNQETNEKEVEGTNE